MGKTDNFKTESIYNLGHYLKEEKMLPIYFLFGEDSHTIASAVKILSNFLDPYIKSEFDKETIRAEKSSNILQILDLAYSFPFGGGKKLLVINNFENISDKNSFTAYVDNPAEFTVLIITQSGKKVDFKRGLYKKLVEKNFIFIANELRGVELQHWIIRKAKELKLRITPENAMLLIDITGENKSYIEMSLIKLQNYLNDGEEISSSAIGEMVSATKEFSIFNLLDKVGEGNKSEALKIAFNLVENGSSPVYIITMLTRFVTTIAQTFEMNKKKIHKKEAAKEAGVSEYFYEKCARAVYFKSASRLRQAAKALLEADTAVKSTSIDEKSAASILISSLIE